MSRAYLNNNHGGAFARASTLCQHVTLELWILSIVTGVYMNMQESEEAERAIKEAEAAKQHADEAWQRAKQAGSQADAELQQELSRIEQAVKERLNLGPAKG